MILFFAGSLRKESLNKKLCHQAYLIAKEMGIKGTYIDLKDYPCPLYDGDLEAESGIPENVLKLKAIFEQHTGFCIMSPEYNSGYSAVLKNVIDWVSRPKDGNEPLLLAFRGKHAAIGSASPSTFGGIRGLVQLKMLLGNIGMTVHPQQIMIPNAFEAFDEQGCLKTSGQMLKDVVKQLG